MANKARSIPISLETFVAVMLALATLATAIAAWRTNVVNSSASNYNREGLILAIKTTAAQGEDWRKVYQEAGYARDYLVEVAAVNTLETSGASQDSVVAGNLGQYLLPGLSSMASPMGTDPTYLQDDGTFDTQKRFLELENQDQSLVGIDPAASFKQAERSFQEQRFLMVGVVLMAISLFWLGLAEISPQRVKIITLVVGICGFLATLAYLGVVEGVFVVFSWVAK